jgi:eukaryotic-like serine/threonine-protein kinase
MLKPGTKLGPYEIVAAIGAGAMGEVYRARDGRLQRDVAVKVLPAGFAADPDRLRRFELEARAAGQLNHTNILAIYDIGTHDGTPYVVSELLEGETLRARVAASELPVRRAIEYAIQIANGLSVAHDHGIVHRDLKPDNVFVTNDGRIKILDFGLAKLIRPDGAALKEYDSLAGTMTASGVILGTAGYMAPEQVRGANTDARSDIFALGAILYEMLSGKRAFHGESAVDTLHAILRSEPRSLPELRPEVSPALERIVLHCLEKAPEQRFQSARDLAFNLEALSQLTIAGSAPALPATSRRVMSRERLAWSVAIAAIVIGAAAAFLPWLTSRSQPPRAMRFTIAPPPGQTLRTDAGNVVVSPDGSMVVFVASDSANVDHLWVRSIESLDARMLAGTDGALLPFWSPDSREIAYFIDGQLKRIPAAGGPSQVICPAASGRGGTWNRDGVILFAPVASGAIFRVAASGGDPVAITSLDTTRHETAQRFPRFFPDGKRFLFVSLPRHDGVFDIYAGTLGSTKTKRVTRAIGAPAYVEPGWLVTAKNQALVAQRFDLGSLAVRGEAQPIGEAPGYANYDGEPSASVADDGTLAVPCGGLQNTKLQWFDATGRELGTVTMPPGRYENLALSPDGKRVVAERRNSATSVDLWVADLARNVPMRLTFGNCENQTPVWSADGNHIYYESNRTGTADFYQRQSSGAGEDEVLYHSNELFEFPDDCSADGKNLIFQRLSSKTEWDIWRLPLDGDRTPVPYIHGPFNEIPCALSPDGRWMAYASDESGRFEVYVQSFPNPTSKYQVSTTGFNPQNFGIEIYWTRGGTQLMFGSADGVTIMVADVQKGDTFQASTPRALFHLPSVPMTVAAASDGRRFLATLPTFGGPPVTITLAKNWAAGLKR